MSDPARFMVSDRVWHAAAAKSYRRRPSDPLYRPLRVFALDPSVSLRAGAVATIDVPFEPVTPGPRGSLFEVVDWDITAGVTYHPVDLDSREVLIGQGLRPSVMEPRSHQQMVYAVAMKTYGAFRTALGRDLQWQSKDHEPRPRLILHPHYREMTNGYYDSERGRICFGYYEASEEETSGNNLPGGTVFTCLSHDIVSHEVSHALLDGLRPHFAIATNPDVLAFHEGLSDLVAVFQRFTYRDIVESAIMRSRGELTAASLLTEVARQFGHTIGRGAALRSAVDVRRTGQDAGEGIRPYRERTDHPEVNYAEGHEGEPHRLGSVLLSAIFDAFNRIFERKARRYVRLATSGSGVLPPGELPSDLVPILAQLASSLATQILTISIRAIDYCPPVDLTFGDYLRALITADNDLVTEDPWGYREAFVDAFRMRKIFPTDVATLSEESLLWKGIPRPLVHCEGLSFGDLRFQGDPANAMSAEEQLGRARQLGRLITDPRNADLFGLHVPQEDDAQADEQAAGFSTPCIESLRTSRRIGPDGQILFDLVAEVVQKRWIDAPGGYRMPFYGGATVIIDAEGNIRYSITQNIHSQRRIERQQTFMKRQGSGFWERDRKQSLLHPHRCSFKLIHGPTTR